MLSSDSLETGTGSSNSLPSTIQSVSFGTYRRIAGKARVSPRRAILGQGKESLSCGSQSGVLRFSDS